MVYGLDITPVPEAVQKMAPANAVWAVGIVLNFDYNKPGNDVMSREIFSPDLPDYISDKMLFLGINDWSRYSSASNHSLRSGGLIEHQDLDWNFYHVGTSECLSDYWNGIEPSYLGPRVSGCRLVHADAPSTMTDAGLEVISVRTFEFSYVPSSHTSNTQAVGRYIQAQLVLQCPELLRKMLRVLGSTGEELQRLTNESLNDMASDEGVHQKYTATVARKS
ncbi:hypothetical protein MMC07_001730 [Pseudocyphellaria aurata]|nr:hypothetical protein [Pseudocyphellaria aurata]